MLSRSLPLSSRMRPRPSLRISPPSDGRSKFVIQRFNKSRSLSLSLSLSFSECSPVDCCRTTGDALFCSALLSSGRAPSFLPSFLLSSSDPPLLFSVGPSCSFLPPFFLPALLPPPSLPPSFSLCPRAPKGAREQGN